MEKCLKHGSKMVIKEMAVGWGNESKLECPECKKELMQASKSGNDQVIFSAGRAGWQ
ncbi:MAG: hypothetical protein WCV70_03840 [Patescibacteria group bacterium]|jgi:hypothetical protein